MTDDRLKEMRITMDDVNNYRRQRGNLRRCGRDVGSKHKSKEPNWYDDFEEATK